MEKKTFEEFIVFIKSKIGTAYIYGAKGTKMTLGQIQSLRKMYGNSMVPLSDDMKAGKVCVDCSGLISWLTGTIRNSTGYKNTATEVVAISKRTNAHIGWAVWCQGHIGIYLGNDQYVAADGSAYGVRIAKLSQNRFTHLLKLCDIDYTIKETNQNVNIMYRVKTQKHGWLKEVENLADYAGWQNRSILAVAMKVDKGRIEYQVHLKGQPKDKWLPKVTGYNIHDVVNGYAGDGKNAIDCIKAYYYTLDNVRPYKEVVYKVNDYDWQRDTNTDQGQDGYAGDYGVVMTKLRMEVKSCL